MNAPFQVTRSDVGSSLRVVAFLAVGMLLAVPERSLADDHVTIRGGLRRLLVVPDPTDYGAKWAVIVGINEYPGDADALGNLEYAANDARAFRELLVSDFGYLDENIFYLTDDAEEAKRTANGMPIVKGLPTRKMIRYAFETWLPLRELHNDDSILFFFAGHGLQEGLLAANDSDARILSTCISIDDIKVWLNQLDCRHKLVILDSCFSGTLFDQPLTARRDDSGQARDIATGEVRHYLDNNAFVGLSAGLGTQPISDGTKEERHSLLTKAILQTMRERADSPREEHVFAFTELAAVVRQRVAESALKRDAFSVQIPMAGRLERGVGDFVFHQSRDVEVPWEQAEREARVAESRRVAFLSESLRGNRTDLSMLLAVEAARESTYEALRSLLFSLSTRPEIVRFLHLPRSMVTSVDVGPRGEVALGYMELDYGDALPKGGLDDAPKVTGGVAVFDATGRRLAGDPLRLRDAGVTSVCFRPDGTLLAGTLGQAGASIVAFDLRGKPLWKTAADKANTQVSAIAVRGDGTICVGLTTGEEGPGAIVILNAAGKTSKDGPLKVPEGGIVDLAFRSDGALSALHNQGVITFSGDWQLLWKVPVTDKDVNLRCLAYHTSGSLVVGLERTVGIRKSIDRLWSFGDTVGGLLMFGRDGTRLWDVPVEIPEGEVTRLEVSLDGIVAAGYTNKKADTGGLVLFDKADLRRRVSAFPVPEGQVIGLAYGRDGTLAVAHQAVLVGYFGFTRPSPNRGSGVLILGPPALGARLATRRRTKGPYNFVNLLVSDRDTVYAGEERYEGLEGLVQIPDKGQVCELRKLAGQDLEHAQAVAFRHDGIAAVAVSEEPTEKTVVLVFDLRNSRLLRRIDSLRAGAKVSSLCFSSSDLLAVAYSGNGFAEIGLLDLQGNLLSTAPKPGVTIGSAMRFSLTGTLVVGLSGIGYRDSFGAVIAYDCSNRTLDPRWALDVPEGMVTGVAFGPDNMTVVGYQDVIMGIQLEGLDRGGGVILIDGNGRRIRPEPLLVPEGGVDDVDISPGGILAAGFGGGGFHTGDGVTGGVVLSDLRGERLTPEPIKVPKGGVDSVSFGPDSILAVGYRERGGDGGILTISVDPSVWSASLARVVNRNMTFAEWGTYFPGQIYRRTFLSFCWPHDLPDIERKRAESAETRRRAN